ncbi:MAG: hypothetical protein CMP06_00680 [Xanthomonadales bacterium]|nr:hypothetical protein [Xanthomonadales bacterium]
MGIDGGAIRLRIAIDTLTTTHESVAAERPSGLFKPGIFAKMPRPASQSLGMKCTVYRSRRHDELYVFVTGDMPADELPVSLRRLTGPLEQAMELELTPERRLARVDVNAVLAGLEASGYYVQMPPSPIKPRLHTGD